MKYSSEAHRRAALEGHARLLVFRRLPEEELLADLMLKARELSLADQGEELALELAKTATSHP